MQYCKSTLKVTLRAYMKTIFNTIKTLQDIKNTTLYVWF